MLRDVSYMQNELNGAGDYMLLKTTNTGFLFWGNGR